MPYAVDLPRPADAASSETRQMPMLAGIPTRPPAVLGRRCPRDEWAPTSHAFVAAARTVPNGADKAMAGLVASAVSRRSHRRLPHCARENPHGASEPRGEVQCKPALPPPSALAALSHAEATPASSYGADADAASRRIAQTGAPLRVRCGTALRSVFATKAHPMLPGWSLVHHLSRVSVLPLPCILGTYMYV